jgi:hypothetical protein
LAKGAYFCYNTRRCLDRLGKDLLTRLMKNMGILYLARREGKAILRLAPLVLVSFLLAVAMGRTDLAASPGLFQSPPTAEPASPTPEPTATLAATEPVAPTAEPTQAPVPTAVPTEIPPTATQPPPPPTVAPPTPTFTPLPTIGAGGPQATPDEGQRYTDEDTRFAFEWGTLFDSVALGASYIWLCCGVFVLILIPLLFIVLWMASRRRRQLEK